MKILIAEDDAVDLQLLQLTLERMGHEVVVTRTGTEAWETFDRAPVRVIVSDWMMPGLDGLEFCHRVRTRPNTPYIYFILLTALGASAENYVLATEAGIDDFLPKPLGSDRDSDATARRAPHSLVHARSSPAQAIDPDLCLLSQNTHGKGLLAALRNLHQATDGIGLQPRCLPGVS